MAAKENVFASSRLARRREGSGPENCLSGASFQRAGTFPAAGFEQFFDSKTFSFAANDI